MALATAATAIAGGVAAAAYLDAKYHFRKDFEVIRRTKTAEWNYAKQEKANRVSAWYMIAEVCQKYPQYRALWSRRSTYTFQELHDRAVQYGQWFLEQGVRSGDLVAMYLTNSAEFIVLWFALLCIGAAPAFVNYNLESKALLHCLDVCETKLLVVDTDEGCQERINGSRSEIESKGMKIVLFDEALQQEVARRPVVVPGDHYRDKVTGEFPYCLIYTSGTTGLPKGCAFTTSRMRLLGTHLEPAFECVPGVDCWYNSMPLYHGTGGIATTAQLLSGVACAIAPKFSVSRFWDDIHNSGATWFIYVGETARYLLSAPPHPLERKHNLRGAYGNGLRPDVWRKFQDRFNIPQIAEFFNSTEGLFGLLNYSKGEYTEACVGHTGLIMRGILYNTFIPLKIDYETGDIWRDPKTGFGHRNSYDEGGEMVVAVPGKEAFQGYWRSQAATDKKFVTDVFKKGDLYYRSGDALRRDSEGKWYFMDRLGDTFRWKSENVSTAEVSEVLGKYPGVAEANVYGVLVPNHEGRAGCAALNIEPDKKANFDFDGLLAYTRHQLPRYAVPVFLRIADEDWKTHNHKQNKVPLRNEGIDPNLKGTQWREGKNDQILWLDPKSDKYVPFGVAEWKQLETVQAKL